TPFRSQGSQVGGDRPAGPGITAASLHDTVQIEGDRAPGAGQSHVMPVAVVDQAARELDKIARVIVVAHKGHQVAGIIGHAVVAYEKIDYGIIIGTRPLGENRAVTVGGLDPAGDGKGGAGGEIQVGQAAVIDKAAGAVQDDVAADL